MLTPGGVSAQTTSEPLVTKTHVNDFWVNNRRVRVSQLGFPACTRVHCSATWVSEHPVSKRVSFRLASEKPCKNMSNFLKSPVNCDWFFFLLLKT